MSVEVADVCSLISNDRFGQFVSARTARLGETAGQEARAEFVRQYCGVTQTYLAALHARGREKFALLVADFERWKRAGRPTALQELPEPDRMPTVVRQAALLTSFSTHYFDIGIIFNPATGAPMAVYHAGGQQTGANLENTARDSCAMISRLLQLGETPDAIAASLVTDQVLGAQRPATVAGAIAETLLTELESAA